MPGTCLHKSHKGENLPDGPTLRAVSFVFSSYLNSLGLAQWECEPSQLGKELHPDLTRSAADLPEICWTKHHPQVQASADDHLPSV